MMTTENKDFPLILLAGGRSSRMGTPKGLLDYQGQPWLVEQLRRFKAVSGKRAVVVLGFHHEQYFKQISWVKTAGDEPVHQLGLEVSVVINQTPEYGQFSSLQCAIAFLEAHHPSPSPPVCVRTRTGRQPSPTRREGKGLTSSPLMGEDKGEGGVEIYFRDKKIPGAFVLPVDVPCPAKEVFEKLARAFSNPINAAIPQYQSKGGHPVLLSAGFLRLLAKIPLTSADARLDLQIRPLPKDQIALVSVHDKNIQLNMNSLDEFQEYANRVDESFRS